MTAYSVNDRIKVSIESGVADVARPDKMNALDTAMLEALIATPVRLKSEPGLRAVVLSGEGRAFCAGIDTSRFAATADGTAAKKDYVTRTHGLTNASQQAMWGWRELPVPVIAAVRGVAFGGGIQLAVVADMRFVAPDTRMSIMEIKWGLVPDMAGTPVLSQLVRDDILRDLIFTGRIFSAQEALNYGLATRICDDPRAAALEAAREIANKNPHAVRAVKRLMNALNGDPGPALMAEAVEQSKISGTPNQKEAVRANLEKRAPKFVDPA